MTKKNEKKDTKKKKVDIIGMDNKPINQEVQKEDVNIPKKFVNVKPTAPKVVESKILLHNGRVYKKLANGYGMYADDGSVFKIN